MLAMHHFVMGNRQDETLGPGVDQAETQFVMVMGAVHRILLDVMQRIVHPAHVPFVGKAQPALLRALADARPRRGLFGNHQRPRGFQRDDVVEMAQEVDGLEVFPTAMTVRHPLAGLARIIAVEHRRHRIDPQAIDMKMLEPVQRRRQHVAVDFGTPEVVDQRVPILVKAFLRVAVLVQRGAVELRQAVGVGGKMRRHPIEDHTDFRLVAGVDERCKLIARAVAGTGGELRQQLVTPRTTERVLHDRHQFDVGEAEFFDIRDQPLGQLGPGVLAGHFAQIVQFALPGTGVQLVDRQRRTWAVTLATGLHPVLVLPVDFQWRGDFRSRVRRQAGGQRHRVGLERQNPVLAEDFVFVGLPRLQARNKQLPDPGGMTQAHRMAATIPDVEITDHRHSPGIWCPDREAHALDAVHGFQLRTQGTAQVTVIALGEQVQIHLTEQRAKAVRVFGGLFAAGPARTQQVGLRPIEVADEQPGGLCRLKRTKLLPGFFGHHMYA
ncbi:hypothetical protein D3C87_1242970 [compost metagenome]